MAVQSKLEIETRTLQKDIESLKNDLAGLKQSSQRMMAEIQALSAMWEGPAKNAFVQQFQNDYKRLESMMGWVQEMTDGCTTAREKYEACESKVGSIISSIKI